MTSTDMNQNRPLARDVAELEALPTGARVIPAAVLELGLPSVLLDTFSVEKNSMGSFTVDPGTGFTSAWSAATVLDNAGGPLAILNPEVLGGDGAVATNTREQASQGEGPRFVESSRDALAALPVGAEIVPGALLSVDPPAEILQAMKVVKNDQGSFDSEGQDPWPVERVVEIMQGQSVAVINPEVLDGQANDRPLQVGDRVRVAKDWTHFFEDDATGVIEKVGRDLFTVRGDKPATNGQATQLIKSVLLTRIEGEAAGDVAEVFTIHDRAGLDALPVGAEILPLDGSDETLTKVNGDAYHWNFGMNSVVDADWLLGACSGQRFQVMNPEILGEFTDLTFDLAGVESELGISHDDLDFMDMVEIVGVTEEAHRGLLVGKRAIVTMMPDPHFGAKVLQPHEWETPTGHPFFSSFGLALRKVDDAPLPVGTVVEVQDASPVEALARMSVGGNPSFSGLRGEIVGQGDSAGHMLVRPHSARPDGNGLLEFNWPTTSLRVVDADEPAPSVIEERDGFRLGDRVRKDDGLGGSEGVIVEFPDNPRERYSNKMIGGDVMVRWETGIVADTVRPGIVLGTQLDTLEKIEDSSVDSMIESLLGRGPIVQGDRVRVVDSGFDGMRTSGDAENEPRELHEGEAGTVLRRESGFVDDFLVVRLDSGELVDGYYVRRWEKI